MSRQNMDRELQHLAETDTIGSAFNSNDDEIWLVGTQGTSGPEPRADAAPVPQPKSSNTRVRFATAPDTPSDDGWAGPRGTTAAPGGGFRSAAVLSDSALSRRGANPAGVTPSMDSTASRAGGTGRMSRGSADGVTSTASSGTKDGGTVAIEPFHTRVNRHRFGAAAQPISASARHPRVSAVPTISTATEGERPSHNLAEDEGLAETDEKELLKVELNSTVKLRPIHPNSYDRRVSLSNITISTVSSPGSLDRFRPSGTPKSELSPAATAVKSSKSRRKTNGKTGGTSTRSSNKRHKPVLATQRSLHSPVDSHGEPIPRESHPSSSGRPSSRKVDHPVTQLSSSDDDVPRTQIKSVRVDNTSTQNQKDWWTDANSCKKDRTSSTAECHVEEELEYLLYDVDGGAEDTQYQERRGGTISKRITPGYVGDATISELKRSADKDRGCPTDSKPVFSSVVKPTSEPSQNPCSTRPVSSPSQGQTEIAAKRTQLLRSRTTVQDTMSEESTHSSMERSVTPPPSPSQIAPTPAQPPSATGTTTTSLRVDPAPPKPQPPSVTKKKLETPPEPPLPEPAPHPEPTALQTRRDQQPPSPNPKRESLPTPPERYTPSAPPDEDVAPPMPSARPSARTIIKTDPRAASAERRQSAQNRQSDAVGANPRVVGTPHSPSTSQTSTTKRAEDTETSTTPPPRLNPYQHQRRVKEKTNVCC